VIPLRRATRSGGAGGWRRTGPVRPKPVITSSVNQQGPTWRTALLHAPQKHRPHHAMPLAPHKRLVGSTAAVVPPATLPVWPGPRFPWPPPLRRPTQLGRPGGPGRRAEQGSNGAEQRTDPPGACPEGVTVISPPQKRSAGRPRLPWFRHHCQAILRATSTAVERCREDRRSSRWRRSARIDRRSPWGWRKLAEDHLLKPPGWGGYEWHSGDGWARAMSPSRDDHTACYSVHRQAQRAATDSASLANEHGHGWHCSQ